MPTQLGRHFWPDFSYILGARVDYLSPTVYLTDLFIFFLLVDVLFAYIRKPRLRKKSKIKNQISNIFGKRDLSPSDKFPKLGFFLLFLLSLVIGVVHSKNPLAGWYGFVRLLEFLFLGLAIAKTKNVFRLVVPAFLISLSLESILGILQFYHHGSLGGLWYFLGERSFNAQTPGIANASIGGELILRPYATFPHPNVLAAYLVIGTQIVLFSLLKKSAFYKRSFLKLGVVFLASTCLLLTMSRIAILLWVLSGILFLFFFLRTRHRSIHARDYALFGAVFVCALIIFIQSPLFVRFFDFAGYGESLGLREQIADAAIRMIANNRLFGVGLLNFLPNLPSFLAAKKSFSLLQPVHNIYILWASQTGVIGFLFGFAFLLKTILRLGNILKSKSSILVCLKSKEVLWICLLGSVLLLGMFDHYFLTLQQGQLLLSLVFGLCWAKRSEWYT